jgi:hypothetical protein
MLAESTMRKTTTTAAKKTARIPTKSKQLTKILVRTK